MAPRSDAGAVSQTLRAVLGIRDLVYSGAASPGERLSEITLSERLARSRTPVRAALARLEQEGLLESIPSGGYAVRALSEADIVDSIELRGVLEGTAARLAAERGVPPAKMAPFKALIGELDSIVKVRLEELDFAAYVARNAGFHEMLAGLSGSLVIRRELERVLRFPFSGPSAFLNAQTDVPAFRASLTIGQAQHRAIAEAIEMREGARAEALAREHARLARQNLAFVLANRSLMRSVPGFSLMPA